VLIDNAPRSNLALSTSEIVNMSSNRIFADFDDILDIRRENKRETTFNDTGSSLSPTGQPD